MIGASTDHLIDCGGSVAVGFVPLLNLAACVVFPFADWPVMRATRPRP